MIVEEKKNKDKAFKKNAYNNKKIEKALKRDNKN